VKEGHNVIDMLEEFGADLKKIILAHTDGVLNIDYHQSLLDRGIIIEYDGLGFEIYHDDLFVGCWGLSDGPKIDVLAELCHQGYERQLLMSQDVCLKIMLSRYGGYGYAHILEHIVPMLRRLDVTKKQIKTMMIDNPQKIIR
jgi:phosphotriesterase-related protein